MNRPILIALVGLLASCGTLSTSTTEKPIYARSAANYRNFDTAEALGQYLRYGGDSGPLISAHRGGSTRAYPENAIATFEHTLRFAPALLEVDVRAASDGVLILMHDDTLGRTSDGSGTVAGQTVPALRQLLLKDNQGVVTPFRIPTLDEALSWSAARTILMLDIKPGVRPSSLVDAIRQYDAEGRVVLIMYTYPQLREYLALAEDLVYSVPASSPEDLEELLGSGLPPSRAVGWLGTGEFDAAMLDRLHGLDMKAMLGTYDEIDDRAIKGGDAVYVQLLESGIDVIATDNAELAAAAASRVARFRN